MYAVTQEYKILYYYVELLFFTDPIAFSDHFFFFCGAIILRRVYLSLSLSLSLTIHGKRRVNKREGIKKWAHIICVKITHVLFVTLL